jgi:hypothetical protein
MRLSEALLPEFDQEMAHTRKTLERVPNDGFGWKPHEKSMTMGRLATHLAETPGWASTTIEKDSLDLAPPGAPPFQPITANSRYEVLAIFDKNIATAQSAIAGASDEHLMKPWSLLLGGDDPLHAASDSCPADLCDEPHHPPSRPAWGLPAAQQHRGPCHLRSFGR